VVTDPRAVVSLVRNVPIPKRAKVVILVHFWRNPACNPLVYHTGISRLSRRKGAFRSELPWLFGKFAVKEGPGKNPRAQPRELPTWTRAKGFQRYPRHFFCPVLQSVFSGVCSGAAILLTFSLLNPAAQPPLTLFAARSGLPREVVKTGQLSIL